MDMSKLIPILDEIETRDLFDDFFHSCVNEICGNKGPTYEQFCKIGWTEEEYEYLHTLIRKLITNPAALYLDKTKMPQEFLDLPESIQAAILKCMKEKQELLVKTAIKNYSRKYMTTVTDFDWRLKMIMGSSKVASLREPLLQLDLKVVENDTESILDLEMDRNELDVFIKALESAI